MAHKPTSSKYQRLVAGFAASAFALLGLLGAAQYEANTVTADVSSRPAVMTNYRASKNCITRTNKMQRSSVGNFHICRTVR